MRQFTAKIERLASAPDGGTRAELSATTTHAAGQFYLALADSTRYLRSALWPADSGGERLIAALPPDLAHLAPGDALDLIGPCGRATPLPTPGQNVLIVTGDDGLSRLRPIVASALSRHCGLTLYSDSPLALDDLPPEIEARFGPTHLSESLNWADVIYVDLPPAELPDLQARLGGENLPRPAPPRAIALVLPPAPCGVGACGACAVPTTRGWQLACADGPAFELNELTFE